MLSDLTTDLRTAVRALWRRPGFTLLVAGTLALGVGAASVVFGLANQVLLSPLPGVHDTGGGAYLQFHSVEDPDRLGGISPADLVGLREAATTLEGIAAYGLSSVHVTTREAQQQAVEASMVHGDFFEVLGVQPVRGRLLTAEESGVDADPLVAVISERLWSRLFGRSEDVVGQTMLTNGQAVIIIGVAGGGFAGPERHDEIDMWMPLSALVPLGNFAPETLRSRESTLHVQLVTRPHRGIPLATAEAEIGQIIQRIGEANPESAANLASLRARLFAGLYTVPETREATYRALGILTGVVAILLLIACANVANLLLFRGLTRKGDVALRRALGASGGRVARQELSESLVLGVMGSTMGLGVGWILARLFRGERVIVAAEEFHGLTFDLRVLGFAAAAVIVTTLLFGVLPAVIASRLSLVESLREAGKQETHRRATLRHGVTAAEFALCVPLLVGALLLTQTVWNLHAVELGMSPEGLVTAQIFTQDGSPGQTAVHRSLLDELEAVPAVESAALELQGVFGSLFLSPLRLPDDPQEAQITVRTEYVTPGWFELLRVRPVSGRTFQAQDMNATTPPRAVITEPLADRLFGRTDVVGRTLLAGTSAPVETEIVGVVGNLRMAGPMAEPAEALFLSYAERPPIPALSILLRPQRFDIATVRQIQQAFAAVFPDLPPPELSLLTARIDKQLATQQLFGRLLRLVSGLAVALVTIGLYGVIAFAVASRRRELGIRIALGATRARIARLVLGQAAAIVATGVVVGLGAAHLFSRILESQLFGVARTDWAFYAAPVAFFAVVAVVACWKPLRSATRVDPAVTLREG